MFHGSVFVSSSFQKEKNYKLAMRRKVSQASFTPTPSVQPLDVVFFFFLDSDGIFMCLNVDSVVLFFLCLVSFFSLGRLSKMSLIDVLRQPAETFAVALSLEDRAHEELQWTAGQFRSRDFTLRTRIRQKRRSRLAESTELTFPVVSWYSP